MVLVLVLVIYYNILYISSLGGEASSQRLQRRWQLDIVLFRCVECLFQGVDRCVRWPLPTLSSSPNRFAGETVHQVPDTPEHV